MAQFFSNGKLENEFLDSGQIGSECIVSIEVFRRDEIPGARRCAEFKRRSEDFGTEK